MGCFRDASACHFAHPHEREWENAHSSLPPKHDAVVDSDSDFCYFRAPHDRGRDRIREREREREKERERDRRTHSSPHFDPPHRKNSATTRASPGPSRKSTLDNSLDGGKTIKGVKSPALSVCSDQLELLRKDSKHHTKDPPFLRQDHAASVPPPSGDTQERVDMPTQMPPVESRFSDRLTPTVPPMVPSEPLKPPPMQPPPPPLLPALPNLPSFASNQQPTGSAEAASKGSKELSVDEQRSAWHERIEYVFLLLVSARRLTCTFSLMFASITSRRDYTKLESNLNQIRLLSNSPLVNNMSDADRANVNSQKMTLELQMDRKRKDINDSIQKLIGSLFWPVLRTPGISEMEKVAGETKKHVLEVRSLLDDVKSSCAALLKTSAADQAQDSGRPSKRRKLEASGQSEDVTEDTTKELEAFRDKLTELDRHLVDLENDIVQRDKIISDEIELHIDARLEAEDSLYPPIKEPTEVSPAEIEAVVDAKNKDIARAVTVTGEEIAVLAEEVAELITKVNTLEARCQALEAENREFKNKLVQVWLNALNPLGACEAI